MSVSGFDCFVALRFNDPQYLFFQLVNHCSHIYIYELFIVFSSNFATLEMQAIGKQVFVAIAIPVIALASLGLYCRKEILEFIAAQSNDAVRIQQNQEERRRRQNHMNDRICSICLAEPKQHQVSSTCSHSFCGECILQLYQHNGQQIKCPLCRQSITLLFKLFQSDWNSRQVQTGLTYYNSLFDDSNRSLHRRIVELPYTLKRLWKSFFSLAFLLFFLRTLEITRWVFIIIVYILLPFDLIPEKVLGFVGYVDDFLFILLILVFMLTLAAMQFYRNQNN